MLSFDFPQDRLETSSARQLSFGSQSDFFSNLLVILIPLLLPPERPKAPSENRSDPFAVEEGTISFIHDLDMVI